MATRISEPYGSQTPDVDGWRKSLRSPSPSGQMPSFSLRSRSPSPVRSKSAREKRSLRSRSPSPNAGFQGAYQSDGYPKSAMKKTSVANGMRRSLGSSATADLSMSGRLKKSTGELANIEGEYIKNLQQQIYFLELEANYLREQARKATEMHPQMTNEAERMLTKLRDMQSEIDKQEMELKRRDSSIGIHTAEKVKLQEHLKDESEARGRDKRLLMDELLTLKKEKDRLQREINSKDEHLLEAKTEVDKSAVALRNAELKINTLKAQLEQRIEQHNLTQLTLEEKRVELLSTSTQLRETEEKYYASTVTIQDKLTQDLRDEIRMLHQKVKHSELEVEKERFVRDKVSEDTTGLVKENANLNQQIMELTNQLHREKELRDTTDERHSKNISELVNLRDSGSNLLHDNDHLRDQLRQEQEKSRQYLEQLTNEESVGKTTNVQMSTLQSRLMEMEGIRSAMDSETSQLRKDKTLLVEHVAELQSKIEDKDREIYSLKTDMGDLDTRFKTMDFQKSMDHTQQSQKWEEFGRLADSMKNLSQSMMSPNSLRNSPRPTPHY